MSEKLSDEDLKKVLEHDFVVNKGAFHSMAKELIERRACDVMRSLPSEAFALLKEILPMQGCIQCQEVYSACDLHGDIRNTVRKIEELIERGNDV